MTHFKLKSMYLKSRFSVALLFILLTGICSGQTNTGTDFWFGFPGDNDGSSATFAVNITSFFNASGTFTIPGAGYTQAFTVTPGTVARFTIPYGTVPFSDVEGTASQACHIVSTAPVAPYISEESSGPRIANSYLLPTTLLGNDYYVMSYEEPASTYGNHSEFLVIGAGNTVTVAVTPTANTSLGHAAGATYTVTIPPNTTYQCMAAGLGDLTGTHVTAVNPSDPTQVFAVLGADDLGPAGTCSSTEDGMFNALIPTYTWGKSYIFISSEWVNDICRILASTNGTQITINGAVVTTLAAGSHYDVNATPSTPLYIIANNPISVGRIMEDQGCNGYTAHAEGDADLSVLMPNEDMYLDSVTFYSNTFYISRNFLQIISRVQDIGTYKLDGVSIPPSNFHPVPSNTAYSYDTMQITPVGPTSPGANGVSVAHELTTTGCGFMGYTCAMSSDGSLSSAIGLYLRNLAFPSSGTASATSTPASCSGCDGTATASVQGGLAPFSYSWSDANSQTTSTATGLCSGTYTVIIQQRCDIGTDTAVVVVGGFGAANISIKATPDTVCSGSPTTVSISGGGAAATYQWSNNATTSSISVSPLTTTTYSVILNNAGCPPIDTSIVVTVNPLPPVVASPHDTSICVGSSAALTASGAVNYSWAPSGAGLSCTACSNPTATPSGTTLYTVTGTDAHGCVSSATSTVNIVVIPPTVSLIAIPKTICEGHSVTIEASASNNITGPLTWQPGSFTGSSITVSPTATTVYTVTATSNCGTATDTVTITVNNIPTAEFSADITNGCAPLCVQFRDQSSTSSGKIIQWVWGYGNGDSSSEQSPIYCYSKAGKYSVNLTVLTNAGCSSSLDVNNYITTYSRPDASFTTSPKPATIVDPTIRFINQSTDRYGIVQWFWTFGDQTDSASGQQNPVHTYQDTGTYCTTLVATNSNGCADTTTNCLVIEPAFTLYIPDAFSPNGDGKNDIFLPKGQYVKGYEMYIFDRWGQQIFHTNNINEGWNGRINNGGATCQEDIYVYLITAYDSRNQKHTYTGSLNLVK